MIKLSVNGAGVWQWIRCNGYRLLCYAVLAFGLVEEIWGVMQLCGMVSSGHPRYPVTGSFYNPGPYGCLIGAIFPVAVYLYLTSRRQFEKVVPGAYVLIAALLLPGGLSRTGWGAAVVGSVVVLAGLYKDRLKELTAGRRWLIGGVVAAGLTALVAGAYSLKPDSADGRLLLWKVGCRAATLTGIGWENVAGAYGDAQEEYFAAGLGSAREEMLAGTPAYVFNEYIQLAIAYGWPAALLFGAVMLWAVVLYWRAGQYGCGGVVAALMAACVASYPFQFVEFKILTAVAAAGALLLIRKRALRYAVVGAWIVASGLFIHSSGEVKIESDFYRAQQAQRLKRYEESNRMLKRLLPKTSDAMPLNLLGRNYQAMNLPDSAEYYFTRSARRVPNRLYPHYLLMNLYAETGDTARMRRQARIVLTKQPKVPSTAIDQMRLEARRLLSSKPFTVSAKENNETYVESDY